MYRAGSLRRWHLFFAVSVSLCICATAPILLNMFRMLIHPSLGVATYLLSYFMGCIALVPCVLVLRCGLAGVVWYPDAGWSSASACIRIPHHHNVTPTHIVPEQYNPWNNSTNKSQALEDGCINIRNMLSIKQWNEKASDIKLVSLYSTIYSPSLFIM